MQVKLTGHSLQYETEQIILLFFPHHENVEVESVFSEDENGVKTVTTKITVCGKTAEHTESTVQSFAKKRDMGNLVKRSAFFAAKKLSHLPAPWGILTSVRPAKPVADMLLTGKSEAEVKDILKTVFLVSDEKIALTLDIAKQEILHSKYKKESASIYIGVPFCPTRCHYCSFISSTAYKGDILSEYTKHLIREIEYTKEIIQRQNIKVDSVYIGGGTPTTLPVHLLAELLDASVNAFGKTGEFTLEAGRPDTITPEKLKIALDMGVDRISINPQSMCDNTLKLIGRNHTAEDFEKAFYLAREMGFDNINSDIIAGLPGEDVETFCDTVNKVSAMAPEAITVHTLYIKRAAWLKNINFEHASPEDIAAMLSYSHNRLCNGKYKPYYLYKQKATLGNLENIGFCMPGYECTYNMKTMSDRQSIIALGAGAASKVVLPHKIERIFNFKNADDYIKEFEKVLEKKRQLESFFVE